MELTSTRLSQDQVLLYSGALIGVVALAALRVFDPATSGVFPPCPLHALTGLYCPGCGSLRAFHQLLHGNLYAAFAMNPLAILTLPFVMYGAASYATFQVRGRYLPRTSLPGHWIWAVGIVIVLYGIARNVPVYPFNLLAPGGLLQP